LSELIGEMPAEDGTASESQPPSYPQPVSFDQTPAMKESEFELVERELKTD